MRGGAENTAAAPGSTLAPLRRNASIAHFPRVVGLELPKFKYPLLVGCLLLGN
jgi:hypothetical protein